MTRTTTPRGTTPATTSSADPAPGAVSEMRAVVQDGYGDVGVLRSTRVPRPVPKDNEVLIRVHAAGLDRGTWHLMTGTPYLLRLGFGLRRPKNPVLGRDVAGTVVETGSAVTRFRVGDEVFGIAPGSFAELAVAREEKVVAKPAGLSFEQVAVVPVSALTALKSVVDVGRVQPGQKVLVLGASGGVGSYAVQVSGTWCCLSGRGTSSTTGVTTSPTGRGATTSSSTWVGTHRCAGSAAPSRPGARPCSPAARGATA